MKSGSTCLWQQIKKVQETLVLASKRVVGGARDVIETTCSLLIWAQRAYQDRIIPKGDRASKHSPDFHHKTSGEIQDLWYWDEESGVVDVSQIETQEIDLTELDHGKVCESRPASSNQKVQEER